MKGSRIKQLREECGLTQIELANRLQISSSAVAMYETDKREASDEIKIKMTEIFGCTLDYLMGKSDIRNPETINIDHANVAFSSGYNGLNETNKTIIQGAIEGLLAKQKLDEEKKEK